MWDSSSHTLYLPQTFLVRVVGFLLPRVGLIPVNTSYISSIPEEVRLQSRVYDSLNPKQPLSRAKDWAVMLQIEYSLANSHHSLSISNFIIFCKVSVSRDLLRAIIQFWNTHYDSRDRNVAKYNEVWCNQKCTVWITCKVARECKTCELVGMYTPTVHIVRPTLALWLAPPFLLFLWVGWRHSWVQWSIWQSSTWAVMNTFVWVSECGMIRQPQWKLPDWPDQKFQSDILLHMDWVYSESTGLSFKKTERSSNHFGVQGLFCYQNNSWSRLEPYIVHVYCLVLTFNKHENRVRAKA